MAARIRFLDDATVNMIAAGEVIERPASILKELVENSLDAGAGNISVSVEVGGLMSISVSDDGCGMSPEDARACFGHHATSKIRRIEDLQSLGSYGFRGEALSSIVAVSRVRLVTREHGSYEGIEIVAGQSKILSSSPVGCPVGTEITVEDLFANVPARRKNLKSKKIELAHCREMMSNYILCRPGLSFTFRSDSETELVHAPAEGMRGSLVTVFGHKVGENMVFGEADDEGVRVEAFLGRLEHNRPSSSDLRLFVNDRPVKSARLVSTVVGAFGSRLMKDRYPAGVFRIFVDASQVDVNVHPSKREVRFTDETLVDSVASAAVTNALEKPDLSFQYDLTKFAEKFEIQSAIPEQFKPNLEQAKLDVKDSESNSGQMLSILPLAQVMDTYILAESRGNLLLIDQHAASERIVYESILESLDGGVEISQHLLAPLVLNLTAAEARVVEENRDVLRNAGFETEPFGKSSYALRSIPTVLGVAQGESALRNILGDLASMSPEKRVGLDVIWRVACHTATRAGDSLSQAQMRQLVADLMKTKSPYTCEHGRPTMIVLSPTDLEKLFRRRV
ncbi:MAG TPA: DNA mismatch repair endonuclease MutL [Thermoplasmata archaeon]|nr:DNA mismatch repair endonuclease MutL [Thermoplasmata archaeon]